MGVSFDNQETQACASGEPGCPGGFENQTVVDQLFTQGYTKSRSFSLYLDDVTEHKGSILFGGVDTAKFTGDLVTMSTQVDLSGDPQNGSYVSQDLVFTSLAVNANGTTQQITRSNYSSTVTLDSGATDMQVPQDIYNAAVQSLPLTAGGNIACTYHTSPSPALSFTNTPTGSAASLDYSITARVTGANGKSALVTIPIAELIVPSFSGNYNSTTPTTSASGEQLCSFNLNAGAASGNLFGDPFLRSAYAFYDLDAKTISLAQPSYNTAASHIVPVDSSKPVPQFVGTGNGSAPANPGGPIISASSSTGASTATSSSPAYPSGYSSPSAFPTGTSVPYPSGYPVGGSQTSCLTHGEFLCNGPTQFGLCNWGSVIWQDVALGTQCKDGAITYAPGFGGVPSSSRGRRG